MRRRPRIVAPYTGVRWSQGDTLAAVLANVPGLDVAFTACLDDVDEPQDLAAIGGTRARRILPAP